MFSLYPQLILVFYQLNCTQCQCQCRQCRLQHIKLWKTYAQVFSLSSFFTMKFNISNNFLVVKWIACPNISKHYCLDWRRKETEWWILGYYEIPKKWTLDRASSSQTVLCRSKLKKKKWLGAIVQNKHNSHFMSKQISQCQCRNANGSKTWLAL